MTRRSLILTAVATVAFVCTGSAPAQNSLPPVTAAEKEAVYTTAIENRTADILKALALTDSAKAERVHDLIINQYRALKARDDVLDAAFGRNTETANVERAGLYVSLTRPLHEQFMAKLSAELTLDQVDKVKDKMTYGKVQFTYDGYCAIVPGLTDQDKAKVMELLKVARDEAVEGGSATEKTAIFQKYKDQINDYLTAHGHDVATAFKEWNAKQELAAKAKDPSASKPAQTP
jgi:hypothetical protein